jgi:hypothetical protein
MITQPEPKLRVVTPKVRYSHPDSNIEPNGATAWNVTMSSVAPHLGIPGPTSFSSHYALSAENEKLKREGL